MKVTSSGCQISNGDLDSQNLPLRILYKAKVAHSKASKSFTFLLSSEFERTLWVEAIETLRRNSERLPVIHLQPEEVETHIRACRTAVEPLGGAMKSSNVQAIGGELQVVVHSLRGLPKHCGKVLRATFFILTMFLILQLLCT